MQLILKIMLIIVINFKYKSCISNEFGNVINSTDKIDSVSNLTNAFSNMPIFTNGFFEVKNYDGFINHTNKFSYVINSTDEFRDVTINSTKEFLEVKNNEKCIYHTNKFGYVINSTDEFGNVATNSTNGILEVTNSQNQNHMNLASASFSFGLPAGGLGIAGGQATYIGDFPHSVMFINAQGVCGGNIISNVIVMTAAHCLDYNQDKNEMKIFADMGEVTNFSLWIDSILDPTVKNSAKTKLRINPLLHGGSPAENQDYPHNLFIVNYLSVCGGVIISSSIVLTGAHCLDTNQNLPDMRIYAGSRYLFDQTADVHMVWQFIIHKKYNQPIRFANDVALLIIHDKFRYKPTVRKALLINHRDWMKDGTVVNVSGWGETIHGEEKLSAKGLQSVELSFLTFSQCKRKAGTALSPDMFCLWGEGERATCKGDSGSGAMWNNMVVGIVSHGGACGKFPGIYTNVYYLRPWIEHTAKKLYHDYCYFHKGIKVGDY